MILEMLIRRDSDELLMEKPDEFLKDSLLEPLLGKYLYGVIKLLIPSYRNFNYFEYFLETFSILFLVGDKQNYLKYSIVFVKVLHESQVKLFVMAVS